MILVRKKRNTQEKELTGQRYAFSRLPLEWEFEPLLALLDLLDFEDDADATRAAFCAFNIAFIF